MNLAAQFFGAFVRSSGRALYQVVSYRPWVGFVLAFLLVVWAGVATSATIPYSFRGINVTRDAGVTHLRGTSPAEYLAAGASVTAGKANLTGSASWYAGTGALVQTGATTFNAAVPIASAAASVAVTAIRANPAGLLTSAAVSWLATSGVSYVQGQFMKSTATWAGDPNAPTPGLEWYGGFGPWGTYEAAKSQILAANSIGNPYWIAPYPQPGCNPCTVWMNFSGSSTSYNIIGRVPPGTLQPATDADFTPLRNAPVPDDVANELLKAGVPLPVGPGTFTPPYRDVNIGDPYVDPVSNKRYQDKARITPSASDPQVADVKTFKQEIDANGQPVVNPGTNTAVPPEAEEKDPCELNPERVGCKELGTPEDVELPTQERGVGSITVQSFGSNATCPADIPLPKGAVLSWSYPCQMATGVKPFLLALAWLAAGLIVIGAVRET